MSRFPTSLSSRTSLCFLSPSFSSSSFSVSFSTRTSTRAQSRASTSTQSNEADPDYPLYKPQQRRRPLAPPAPFRFPGSPTILENPNYVPFVPIQKKQARPIINPLTLFKAKNEPTQIDSAKSPVTPPESTQLVSDVLPLYSKSGFEPTLLRPLPWIKTEQPKLMPAPWTPSSRRIGLIAQKIGMMRLWDAHGISFTVTVLHVDSQVIHVKQVLSPSKLVGVQVGYGIKKPKKVSKAMMGHYKRAGVHPKSRLVEFPVTPDAVIPPAYRLNARHFVPGQYVDIRGITVGYGYQGAMKKWHFGGLNASHGVSISHRSLGATGSRQDPGRVFKNKKMAGRMGGVFRTDENKLVYKIDPMRNLIFIKGSVPGHNGNYVTLRDSFDYPHTIQSPPPFPTWVAPPGVKELPEQVMKPVGPDPFAYGGV
jgi:large subunit ribosomal protein L3